MKGIRILVVIVILFCFSPCMCLAVTDSEYDEIFEQAVEAVKDDPGAYDLVSLEDYQDLEYKYDRDDERYGPMYSLDEIYKPFLICMAITAALTAFITYKVCNRQ